MHPGLGSFIVNESNRTGDLPSYISIGGMAPRAGYLGQRCEAYYVGLGVRKNDDEFRMEHGNLTCHAMIKSRQRSS